MINKSTSHTQPHELVIATFFKFPSEVVLSFLFLSYNNWNPNLCTQFPLTGHPLKPQQK